MPESFLMIPCSRLFWGLRGQLPTRIYHPESSNISHYYDGLWVCQISRNARWRGRVLIYPNITQGGQNLFDIIEPLCTISISPDSSIKFPKCFRNERFHSIPTLHPVDQTFAMLLMKHGPKY